MQRGSLPGGVGLILVSIGALVVYVPGVASRAIQDTMLGAALLPGVLFLMVGLRTGMRDRVLLTSGLITGGIATGSGRRGEYSFRDDQGTERSGRTLPAGVRSGDRVHVVFDPGNPRVHRCVTPAEFVR